MEFSEWITKKYIEWRGDAIGQERSITEFAKLIGVPQSLMSQWMKKNGKIPSSKKNVSALVKVYGIEAYEALGFIGPKVSDVLSELPPVVADDVRRAIIEISISGLNKEKAFASPEDIVKIRDILVKHLGKYQETEH